MNKNITMNLTQKAQNLIRKNITLDDMLPTKMPIYVNSSGYLFGVITLCALLLLVISGVILAFFGPTWDHFSKFVHFVNSVHFVRG